MRWRHPPVPPKDNSDNRFRFIHMYFKVCITNQKEVRVFTRSRRISSSSCPSSSSCDGHCFAAPVRRGMDLRCHRSFDRGSWHRSDGRCPAWGPSRSHVTYDCHHVHTGRCSFDGSLRIEYRDDHCSGCGTLPLSSVGENKTKSICK